MVYKFFDKKFSRSGIADEPNYQLANELHKSIIRKFKKIHFDVLAHIVNKYNNTIDTSIKMKPIDVTDDSYAGYNEDFNKKDPKFKVGGHVRISKYKSIFAKGYTPNWLDEVFVVSKIKNTVPWTYVISEKKLLEVFKQKNCKKLAKKTLEKKNYSKEKVINCTSNGKGMITHLMVGLIKKTSYKNG